MKVSPEIVVGLKRLANTSLVSDENVDKLLSSTSAYLENPKTYRVDISPDTPKIDILKECYASLVCLLIESIRHDVDSATLFSLLESYKFNQKRAEGIIRLYSNHKINVMKSLKLVTSEPPYVYDVKWRLNFCVKSSFSDLEDKAVYFIDFVIGHRNEADKNVSKITFVCTIQHLQELVSKLKAATRRLEVLADVR